MEARRLVMTSVSAGSYGALTTLKSLVPVCSGSSNGFGLVFTDLQWSLKSLRDGYP